MTNQSTARRALLDNAVIAARSDLDRLTQQWLATRVPTPEMDAAFDKAREDYRVALQAAVNG